MIAAVVNNSHIGRKLKISSLDGLIVDVRHSIRGQFTDLRHKPNIDVHIKLETSRGVRHYVLSPRTEVAISYPVLDKHYSLDD